MKYYSFIIRMISNDGLNDFWIGLFKTTKVKVLFVHLWLRLGFEILHDNQDRVKPYFCVITASADQYLLSSDISKTVQILWDTRYKSVNCGVDSVWPHTVESCTKAWRTGMYKWKNQVIISWSLCHENRNEVSRKHFRRGLK